MLNIRLDSDFIDYYDHAFSSRHDPTSLVLSRKSYEGPTKREQFRLLEAAGWEVVRHGFLSVLASDDYLWHTDAKVVVYTDELAHAGEGKVLLPIRAATLQYPDVYASVYTNLLREQRTNPVSYRLLNIGRRQWLLEYYNRQPAPGEWRSNVGPDVRVRVVREATDPRFLTLAPLKRPLWAIDMLIRCQVQAGPAIDFNVSPGLRGTGIEDILSAREVYELIAEAMHDVD